MKTNNKKKKKNMGKIEKIIYTVAILLVFASPFAVVFFQATLSKVNTSTGIKL